MGDLLEDRLREADRRAVQQPITETIFPSKPYEEVNHPEHYGGDTPYEVIKVMRAWLTPEEFVGALKFNIHKYTMRLGKKPGVRDQRDAEKVAWYSDYLATYLAERTNAEERKRGNTDSGSR